MDYVALEAHYLEVRHEEEQLAAHQEKRARFRELRDASDPFSESEESFRGMYRLSKELTRALIVDLRPFLADGQRTTAISVELKVLCALHFYAQGSYQKGVGRDNNIALSQPCVSRAIEEVTNALNQNEILSNKIHFPMTTAERQALQQRNFRKCHIPGVLGFVDGTHVAIVAPAEHEELYVNRKGYHSMNAQIVCDSEYKIINIVSRYNGSSHDSFIWATSSIRQHIEEIWRAGEECWLLGDSGYPLEPWLHTPILNAAPGSNEENYTRLHLTARSTVERCIGLLKNRFRCLLKHRVLHYAPCKAGRIINACAVLHNMCLREPQPQEELPVLDEAEDIDQPAAQAPRGNPLHDQGVRVRAAVVARLARQRN